jgi:predicted nuclease with RNAse H fold
MSRDWRDRWLGIDFSGNRRMWSTGCGCSNVWIADVRRNNELVLCGLRRVQELSGDGTPFQRLRTLLADQRFNAAGIDAPFSVPSEYIPLGSHRGLLTVTSAIQRPVGRCFPVAHDFVDRIISGRDMSAAKPLRETEKCWQKLGVNVRSTLWAGSRGGAAMTSACLTLLNEAGGPIWPWDQAGPGLLVEAFPAAQLSHWELPHQRYSGKEPDQLSNRRRIIGFLSQRMTLDRQKRQIMADSVDALDAVICAYAAIAVTTGRVLEPSTPPAPEEGLIAVHSHLECETYRVAL